MVTLTQPVEIAQLVTRLYVSPEVDGSSPVAGAFSIGPWEIHCPDHSLVGTAMSIVRFANRDSHVKLPSGQMTVLVETAMSDCPTFKSRQTWAGDVRLSNYRKLHKLVYHP